MQTKWPFRFKGRTSELCEVRSKDFVKFKGRTAISFGCGLSTLRLLAWYRPVPVCSPFAISTELLDTTVCRDFLWSIVDKTTFGPAQQTICGRAHFPSRRRLIYSMTSTPPRYSNLRTHSFRLDAVALHNVLQASTDQSRFIVASALVY